MLIALIVIIGLSLLIIGHEAGHFFVAKLFRLKVDEFGIGFPPRIAAKRKGETEYSINWLPFGGFVKIAGEHDHLDTNAAQEETAPRAEKDRLFSFQPPWRRSVIVLAGIVVNFLIGWFLFSAVLMIGTPTVLIIGEVEAGSPAEGAGIMPGDIIKHFTTTEQLSSFIEENRGKPTDFEVIREGNNMRFTITPRIKTDADESGLGILYGEAGFHPHAFFAAIGRGFVLSVEVAKVTIATFYELLKELLTSGRLLTGVVGPVGIFSFAQATGQLGFTYLLQLISLISINLAIINLVPFPALDGGRFLLILIEKIKGSPIPRKVETALNATGFVLLILLMIVITVRDIINL